MTRSTGLEIRPWGIALGLMSLLGICLVGALVLGVGLLFSRLNGEQPVPLHSPLRANYSVDSRAISFPALSLKVVEEAIHDQVTSTADAEQQWEVVVEAMQTPVATVTPYFTQVAATNPPPTLIVPSATANQPGFTPSASLSPAASQTTTLTATFTLTSTGVPTFTLTPTVTITPGIVKPTLTRTLTPTNPPVIIPSFTPTATRWITLTPTETPVPSTTATFTPTNTISPSLTPTLPPPPTDIPTPTHTLEPYPPPSTPYP